MILFENEYVILHHHPEINCIEYEWKGFVPADQFRSILEKTLLFFKEKKASQLLPNLVKIRSVSPAEQTWFEQDLMPRFVKAGLKRAAIVRSATTFGAVVNKTIMQKLDAQQDGVERALFSDYEEAKGWLHA